MWLNELSSRGTDDARLPRRLNSIRRSSFMNLLYLPSLPSPPPSTSQFLLNTFSRATISNYGIAGFSRGLGYNTRYKNDRSGRNSARRSAINFFSREKPGRANGSHALMPPAVFPERSFFRSALLLMAHSLMTNIGRKKIYKLLVWRPSPVFLSMGNFIENEGGGVREKKKKIKKSDRGLVSQLNRGPIAGFSARRCNARWLNVERRH